MYVLIPVSAKMTSFNSKNGFADLNGIHTSCVHHTKNMYTNIYSVQLISCREKYYPLSVKVLSDSTEDGWWHPLLYLPALWVACTAILMLFATTHFRT
jgi:hypothetical protein